MAPDGGQSRWSLVKTVGGSLGGIAAFVAAVVGSLAAFGVIGGSGSSASALEVAAQKTADAGSSRIVLSRTLRHGSDTFLDKATGAFDYVAETGHLEFTNGLQQVFLKPYLYQFGMADSRVWCKYDLSTLGPGFLFGAITGFRSDPAAALENLEENGTYEEKGTEVLFGVETTRYAGRVDFNRLVERVRDPTRREFLKGVARYNETLPIQVWIGEDDLPRRIKASFSVPGSDYGLEGIVKVDATIDFSRFGSRVVANPPPRSRTFQAGVKGCPLSPF